MNNLTILIVTYNNADCIDACLGSLSEAIAQGAETIVIDNASRDDTRDIVKKHAGVNMVKNKKNTGFCAACNQGVKMIDRPFVLFLNPDTFTTTQDLANLVKALEGSDEKVIGAGPKLLLPYEGPEGQRILDSVGIVLAREILSPYDKGHRTYDNGQHDSRTSNFGPSFACALFKKEPLVDLSVDGELFDEAFFAYYEDVDIVWRARNRGHEFLFVPSATVFHDRKNPVAHSVAIRARAFVNRWFCTIKNDPRLMDHFPGAISYEFLRLGWKTFKHPGFVLAWSHYFRYVRAMFKKRKAMETHGRLTAEQLKELDE